MKILLIGASGFIGPHVVRKLASEGHEPRAAGRIYNIAKLNAYSELEWVQRIGQVVTWEGRVVPVSKELMPQHLRVPYNTSSIGS